MVTCIGCGQLTVDPSDPPRYDVFNPNADPNNPPTLGPYDATCFALTFTGQKIA